ncbi:MAG: hypothetical protein PSV17_03275 [Methylotenera sp.]|uniref:hypothetical protein n=1 Tax=Methylotenera sp. TaxID=2051956 RepID=UPI00248A8641|nr:hypothetical protein [Methylotenera sp.]MDI1308438.1 hypothetical protein [Methylotenera sp.]
MVLTEEELFAHNSLRQYEQEKQESDIDLMIGAFHASKYSWKSLYEVHAYKEQCQINLAKQKIRDFQIEINNQLKIIEEAEEKISTFKVNIKEENAAKVKEENAARVKDGNEPKDSKGRGRPERSEGMENIAKKFITKWVHSLMVELEVSSCTKLQDMICSTTVVNTINKKSKKMEDEIISSRATERNWRRWRNGETIPTYSTLYIILSAKIESGKYSGKMLLDVPTTPEANALLTLLHFM